jgi:hypothetical protein
VSLRIGLDLDNTIISYDRAFAVAALERGLIPPHFSGTKQQIRDHIRTLPGQDGEIEWQKLQGYVYGTGIIHAEIFPGVMHFLERAREENATLFIVSHKTQFGHFDPERVDLRKAAMQFIRAKGVLAFIPENQVSFHATRTEKIEKIKFLGCDVFVDDLEEVLDDPQFPASVRKLLFTTAAGSVAHAFDICRNWAEIENGIFDDDRIAIASALLGAKASSVVLAGGGGNSRIYRVQAGSQIYALKMYPKAGNDTRDRLGAERKALKFFERHDIHNVPRWLGDSTGYGLLTWVEGTLANPPEAKEIDQAVDFLGDIKRLNNTPAAKEFAAASEACISGGEIVRQIERRLHRLREVAPQEPTLAYFLNRQFAPAYATALTHARAEYAKAGIVFDTTLAAGLSLIPADFGFHNTMRGQDGKLTFIDFEYFGWDDPVKLTADFLLHPAMKLDKAAADHFRSRMCALFADDPFFAARLEALLPLFALRWALILLNEFLPERWSGRAFAQGQSEWAAAKKRQLDKAQAMLENTNIVNV